MARELGVSKATVQRIWSENEIKPYLTRAFKLSSDPHFEAKFLDVIGLYLNPPERAVVLCCDEKCQIQALQRSQPGLPLGKGHIRTQTHDYYRNGTVTLFAALDYLQGKVIAYSPNTHPPPVAGVSQANRPRNSFEPAHPHHFGQLGVPIAKNNVKPVRSRAVSAGEGLCDGIPRWAGCHNRWREGRARRYPVIGSGFASFGGARSTHYQKFSTGLSSDNEHWTKPLRGMRRVALR